MATKTIQRRIDSEELSKKKREEIFTIIRGRIGTDDRLPEEIIRDDFNGDEESYLRIMADLYGVKI